MKNYLTFLLMITLLVITNSCQKSENSELHVSGYNVLESPEFKKFCNLNDEFSQTFHLIYEATTEEDISALLDLYDLYQKKPAEYGTVLEDKLKSMLGADYEILCNKLIEMRTQLTDLNNKYNLSNLEQTDRMQMVDKMFEYSTNEYTVQQSLFKNSNCATACAKSRDSAIRNANENFGAAAGGGLVLWAGGFIGGGLWLGETIVAAYVRDRAVSNAWTNYNICISQCQ